MKISRWILNIFIVWGLTGLWHGASWNFIIWGLYYGGILIIEKMIFTKFRFTVPRAVNHLYTLIMIIIGWIVFRTDTIFDARNYIVALFGGYGHSELKLLYSLSIMNLIIFMILGILGATPLIKSISDKLNQNFITSILYDAFVILVFLSSLLFLVNNSFNPFIYFRF